MPKGNCEFKATGGQYFSAVIFHLGLFSPVTLGLYFPWALVRLFKLKASHTTIQGKKTTFSGTGVLKSKIVRNKTEKPLPSAVLKPAEKVKKSKPATGTVRKEDVGKPASSEKIPTRKPRPDNQDFENNLKKLDLFIKENPNNGMAFYNRACLYGSKGDLNRALEDYTEAIRINSENADAYYNRGIIRVKMKKYHMAVQDFQKVVTLKPAFQDAYCNRGNTYYALGKYDLAIQDYTKALKMGPKDGDVLFNRGLAYLALEQKAPALSDSKKASQRGRKQAEGYLKRAKDL